jgi:rare lipoprotein A
VAVNSERERNRRAGFFVARIGIAAGISGAVAACSLGTITTSMDSPKPVTLAPQAIVAEPFAPAAALAAIEAAPPAAALASPPEEVDEATLRARPYRRIGKPYQILGSWYEPKDDPNYDQTGMASWYGAAFHGRMTANGEIFDSAAISAAHPTLPLPSYVRVTNLENDRSIVVRVNDRGPFRHKRLIDVSEHTAQLLGFHHEGMTKVRVQYVSRAPLEREPEAVLMASYHGPNVPPADAAPVMLAAAEPASPPPQRAASRAENVVAFATEAAPGPNVAIATLTEGYSADDRILMAFDVASALPQ